MHRLGDLISECLSMLSHVPGIRGVARHLVTRLREREKLLLEARIEIEAIRHQLADLRWQPHGDQDAQLNDKVIRIHAASLVALNKPVLRGIEVAVSSRRRQAESVWEEYRTLDVVRLPSHEFFRTLSPTLKEAVAIERALMEGNDPPTIRRLESGRDQMIRLLNSLYESLS